MQRESNQAAAGEVCGRVRTYCARKTLCDAGVRPYSARTTLYPVRTTLRACVTLSRGIPLIPLNPAESRLEIKFCPRWDGKPDRDRGETCGLEGAEGGAEALGGVAEDAQVVGPVFGREIGLALELPHELRGLGDALPDAGAEGASR